MKYATAILALTFSTILYGQELQFNERNYLYDDLNRLVQVDFYSGETYYYTYDELGNRIKIEFSEEIINFNPEVLKNPITIYPNPTSENLTIDLPTDQDWTNAQIQLFTCDGVLIQNINPNISSSKLELNIHQLPSGAYTIHIRNKENTWTKIIIKQ